MRPSTQKYQDSIIEYVRDCPTTKAHIQAAEDIFGPDIQAAEDSFGPHFGLPKGKTVCCLNAHVEVRIGPVSHKIMNLYKNIMIAVNITSVNKILFFITVSQWIVVPLSN
jgi:hypothetical protein